MNMRENLAWTNSLPPGWGKLFERLIAAIAKEDAEAVVTIAKEKFGALRVHLDGYAGASRELIDEASRQSVRTCQRCGAQGELTVLEHCYETPCEQHTGLARKPTEYPILVSFRVWSDGKPKDVDRS